MKKEKRKFQLKNLSDLATKLLPIAFLSLFLVKIISIIKEMGYLSKEEKKRERELEIEEAREKERKEIKIPVEDILKEKEEEKKDKIFIQAEVTADKFNIMKELKRIIEDPDTHLANRYQFIEIIYKDGTESSITNIKDIKIDTFDDYKSKWVGKISCWADFNDNDSVYNEFYIDNVAIAIIRLLFWKYLDKEENEENMFDINVPAEIIRLYKYSTEDEVCNNG